MLNRARTGLADFCPENEHDVAGGKPDKQSDEDALDRQAALPMPSRIVVRGRLAKEDV